jgi:hypothetical protein
MFKLFILNPNFNSAELYRLEFETMPDGTTCPYIYKLYLLFSRVSHRYPVTFSFLRFFRKSGQLIFIEYDSDVSPGREVRFSIDLPNRMHSSLSRDEPKAGVALRDA